jgi:hypothetical protein
MFAAVLGAGLVFRIARYGGRDSLWGDEAMLATSIVSRPIGALVPPLDYAQLAPVPFLWLERAAVALAGPSELALRAVPLLASCLALGLMVPFTRALLPPLEALLAVGFAATSTSLIRYASELKPYGLDGLVTLLLVWAALAVRRAPDRAALWAALALAAVLGAFVSTPAVFVLGGIAVGLGLEFVRERRLRHAAALALLCAAGVAVTAFGYVTWYRAAAGNAYMRDFWQAALLQPGTPGLATRLSAGLREAVEPTAEWLTALGLGWAIVGLMAVGAVHLWQRRRPAPVLMLTLPLGFAFLASAGGFYPVALRLLLFAAPLVVCLFAAGVVRGAVWLHARVPSVRTGVLAVAVLIPSTEIAIRSLVVHPRDEEMRPLVQAILARGGHEPVYVFHRCIPAWSFYTTDWSHPDTARMRWVAAQAGPGGPAHENGESRGARPPGEGADLARRNGPRLELLGLASGIRGRQWLGYQPAVPDAGWSANEAARIRAAAAAGIWMVLVNADNQAEGDSLLAAVRGAGGQADDSVIVPGGKAMRVTFASAPPRGPATAARPPATRWAAAAP